MKAAFIILTFMIMIALNASMACSVYVDNDAQKEFLAAQAASYLALNPATITSTSFTDYSKTFSDEDPDTLCAQALHTEVTVKFTYKPSEAENCVAQATVEHDEYIGEDPTISFEAVAVTEPSASCSIRPIRMIRPSQIPSRIPRRPVKPIRP